MFDLRPPNSKIVEILGLIQGSIVTTAKMSVFLLPKQNPETTEKTQPGCWQTPVHVNDRINWQQDPNIAKYI